MGHNSKRGLGGQTDLTLNPDPVNYYLCDLGKAAKTSLNQGFLSFFFFFNLLSGTNICPAGFCEDYSQHMQLSFLAHGKYRITVRHQHDLGGKSVEHP